MNGVKLPSWRPGATRDAVEVFLEGAEMLPLERRVAVFDVDGTLWCEKPRSPEVDFFIRELRTAVADRPDLAARPAFRAVLDDDSAAIARLGPVNVVLALTEVHAGITPEAFEARVLAYFEETRHPDRRVPLSQMRYRPMLELIGELRARHFSMYVATGTGTEVVRAVSRDWFGVDREGVVGAQAGYELVREAGVPRLLRTRDLLGDPNDGPARMETIQRLVGRRPILAAGNSAGDAAMLDYALASAGPSLALLVRHDDAGREYAYGAAATHRGWTVVSMRDDWAVVFADS